MTTTLTHYRVGSATITRLAERSLHGVNPATLFPSSDPERLRNVGPSLDPRTIGPDGTLRQSLHAWLVRTPEHTLLVDTATGNGKNRPTQLALHRLDEPFLERLENLGVTPEQIDVVLHTHLHADHVGWNTALRDGRWEPVFRNAVHYFSAREAAYQAALATGDGQARAHIDAASLGPPVRPPGSGVYEDSVAPVIEAGLARPIEIDGTEFLPGWRFLASPGHSIDHASLVFESQGERALFWGDVLHHPLQAAHPEWNSVYCEFPEAAIRSRRWALSYAAETNALVLTTHFADPSAGHVRREGGHFRWQFA